MSVAPPPGFVLEDQPAPQRRSASSLPPPPPGFELKEPEDPGISAPVDLSLPSLANDSIVSAVDGDTARLSSGRNLRMFGADAPELKQLGWDRQGQPVPIGQQSRQALTDRLARGAAILGAPRSMSYGRPVAPFTIGGKDAGEAMIRSGEAYAAPEYLKADPQRRYNYMQAERLARLNGLGVHDTYTQMPSDFRHNPQTTPDRETVARFWDTPTPWAGVRPEVEKRILEMTYDPQVPISDIAEYAKANGGTLDIDTAEKSRAYFLKYGKAGGLEYERKPKILTDMGDGKTGAAVRGLGTGALAGGLDEAGALVDSLGLTDGRENVFNSDRRFADIWANNQDQNSAILGYDSQEHPYVTTAGELAGGLIAPFGAGAKTVPELFRVGAAYGAASGFLGTDGGVGDRAIGGAIGTALGGAVGAGAGKALELAAPLARSAWARFRARAGENAGALADNAGLAFSRTDSRTTDAPAPPPGFVLDELSPYVDGPPTTQAARTALDETSVSRADDMPPPPPGFVVQDRERSSAPMMMADEPMPSISQDVRRPDYLFTDRPTAMDQPLTDAQRTAMAERIDPRDLTPIPSNEIGSVEEAAARDAGRYAPATAPNERGELTRQTVRAYNGAEVPKVGPIDLVGFLRLRGGLADQGGELSHMGLTNQARRGMDFVGQEQRFGPLVNEQGARLDDAAEAAWEAGYFPDHTERPTTAEFLDALRDTHEGRNRHFLPEDYAEIDRFYGAQSERQALQQQRFESGQPVYRDKSVPADEAQPFPPPEAYDEWGSGGGPDFAGNLRLEKLETPQDISRALATIEKRVGFDAATRGRVSNAETERLAAELNMTPETLIARREGQAFNAEEALAARQILAKSSNELVNAAKRIKAMDNPGDDLMADFQQKLVRHVAIQEQIAGATAEAGRALQQFSMVARSNAIRRDVLTSMVQAGGGEGRVKATADILLDTIETEPDKFQVLASQLSKPKLRDKLTELWINSLLTSPATHVVNMTSNTLTALGQIPEHAVAAVIGKGRELVKREAIDRVTSSEVGARAFGLLQGAKEGARLFAESARTGQPSDIVSKVEGIGMKAISGRKGEIVRIPTRFLTAEDELFKGIARRMEINGEAVRIAHREGLKGDAAAKRIAELVANPTDAMLERSFDYARYVTFQNALGPIASKISGITQAAPALKLFLPFVRTPTNLLKFAAERSPAAPLLAEWRREVAAGGARRDIALARAMVGTGFGAAIYQAAQAGYVTGSRPSDPAKAKLLYADGWQPNSIKIGGTYYSYRRLDPFSTTLGVAADLATLQEGMSEKQQQEVGTLLVASILGNLANKTWLSGISDIVGALNEPDRNADRLVQRLVSSLAVPAAVGQVARTIDPVQRETDTVLSAIQAKIPFASQDLPARRDVWGRPVVSEGGVGPDLISPVYTSTAKNDPVNRAMRDIGYAPGKVQQKDLTALEYDRYQELAGGYRYENLRRLITSPDWRSMDGEAKEEAAHKASTAGAKQARAELFGTPAAGPRRKGLFGQRAGNSASAAPPAPPPGFAIEGEAGGVNVYRDLQEAIPGLGVTSGYRTPEYQADMRRRGYHPASNSGHLDGSALDLLPPPGKSMGWLKGQVSKLYPNARLLNEGDHLHATFPGYYGAPVLGGAARAGLKNPAMGMPAPPPGFVVQ